MTAFTLRDYQHQAIASVRNQFLAEKKRVLLRAPTGSGKTVLTAYMMRTAYLKGQRTWFLVHRKELLDQTSEALWKMDVPHGAIAAGRTPTDEKAQVASVQTLVRRLGKLPSPKLIVIDEAHHATAATYLKILAAYPEARIVGLTATPERTDGTGLNAIFDSLVHGPELGELIDKGFLSPFRVFSPPSPLDMTGVHMRGGDYAKDEVAQVVDQTSITGDAVAHYMKLVAPKTCLVYCVSRKHARHVEAAYRAAGVPVAYVAGDTPKEERNKAIRGFRKGWPRVIVSVDLFGEGLDVPGLAAVQLLRPTQSLVLHLQQVGRALRVEEGKDEAVVLDHVGNTWRHGFPDDKREWTLEGKKRKRNDDEAAVGLRHCPECFCIFPAALRECPLCGFVPKANARKDPKVVEGELEEIRRKEIQEARDKRTEQGLAKDLEGLVALAIKHNKKISWAGIVYSSRRGANMDKRTAIRESYRIAKELKQTA